LDKGADDYLTKPFNARELMARVRVNINLSYLRRQLLLQQRRQAETKQLLFSISNTIHSGFNLKKTLSIAVEEIHRVLPADRILIMANEKSKKSDGITLAFSAKDKNEMNLEGQPVKFTSKRIGLQEGINSTIDTTLASIMPIKQNQPKLLELESLMHNNSIEDNITGGQDITNAISHLPSCNSLSTSFGSESASSISTINSTTSNSSDEDLEIAVIPNFYSTSIQKYVSLLAIAIKVNNSTWGWIKVHRPPNHSWSDSEKEFLQQISNQISLAITHAKLLEDQLKREAQIEAARAANEAKSQILANTSHGTYENLIFFFHSDSVLKMGAFNCPESTIQLLKYNLIFAFTLTLYLYVSKN
jgi:GAF domain-containing protein